MRIAILGGTGRTGRHVIDAAVAAGHTVRVLSREAFDQPGTEAVRGDALDPDRLRTLVRGVDAVICVLGPVPDSPADVCSRATALLVDAMKTEGVRRLVVQTGAMIGHSALGPFYRWMRARRGLQPFLEERRAQERIVQTSGLDWTLVRPPRLTNGPCTGAERVGVDLPIHALSSVPRSDVAQVLVRAATTSQWTGEGVATLPAFTARRPVIVLWRWISRMGAAELLGIALAAAVAVTFVRSFGEPQRPGQAIAFLLCMIAVGAIEGLLLGHLPGHVLVSCFPKLSLREFRRNTVLVTMGAWLLGFLPSTLSAGSPGAALVEPSTFQVALFSALAGAFAGAVIGGAQWLALRKAVPRASRWIAASSLGWALALPLDVLAGTLPSAADHWLRTVTVAAALGLSAGVLVALPTGALLVRLLRERGAPAEQPLHHLAAHPQGAS
jgi:uncharacterized protein YbjT (DUF2867 family)